jgi:branched-chain amino acid transport system substrate-binding protein
MKRLFIPLNFSLGLWLLLILLLPAAASSQESGTTPKTRSEIIIGTHLPLSGMSAPIGDEQRWAYEAAVADVNAAGGIFVREYGKRLPVRLIVLDDGSEPSRVVKAVERLVKVEQVDFILSGHTAVQGVIPGCIVAEMYHKYYHGTACFIPPWRAHNFQWSTLLFFDMGDAAAIPFKIWNSLPAEQRPRKAALFMEDTYDGLAFGGMFQKKAAEYGYSFALDISFPIGSRDYSQPIIKAKELGVDAILMYGSTEDCITLIRQMKAVHYRVRYLHGWRGTWPAEFGQAMGKDAQYIVSDAHWSENYPFKGAKSLGERYYKAFKKRSVSVGTFYALAQILWQAIEDAGSLDSAMVRRAVLRGQFRTVLGTISYNSKGVGLYHSFAVQWIDGRQVTIYPFEQAKHKLRLPPNDDWRE